jgi:hypothetical protein
MYVIKNMKNKQSEWHPATKPLKKQEEKKHSKVGEGGVGVDCT